MAYDGYGEPEDSEDITDDTGSVADDALMAKLKDAGNPTAIYRRRGTLADPQERETVGTFDADAFLTGLDAIFAAHEGATKAGPYLEQAAIDAENAGDDAGLLTVLNETIGYYRSQGRHADNQWVIQRALELAARMGLEGSEAWTGTLINAATGMRAAGNHDQAEDLYRMALRSAERTLSPIDRRLAALHNNLSMLYSETDRAHQAEIELREALRILESASVNAGEDIDVASTNTNLALVLLTEGKLEEAERHAATALGIYRTGHLEHEAHYASALAGYAQVRFAAGEYGRAAVWYRRALAVIEECYGTDADSYATTADNLHRAEEEARRVGQPLAYGDGDDAIAHDGGASADDAHATALAGGAATTATTATTASSAATAPTSAASTKPSVSAMIQQPTGLQLSRAFWNEVGKPMVEAKYPEYRGRIAAGLVGHGSECYGFDDARSRDHDFGPRFCLWLTDEDYARIGERLQADYEALPGVRSGSFMGVSAAAATPRAQGAGRRDGVFAIGDFFESITGYRMAPAEDRPYEWMMLDEATLAAATNGEVFADPLGAFSKARQGFTLMPEDVRLALVSRRLGMMAQAGQYNVPRMLERGDGAAAWLAVDEFVRAAASLVFLLNQPVSVGYLPYYKWSFAALRRLSGRVATRLADVCGQLESLMRLASAACFGGAGFGEGGRGAAPAAAQVTEVIERICGEVVAELRREGLTPGGDSFLEWQRPYVEEHIVSREPCLRSL